MHKIPYPVKKLVLIIAASASVVIRLDSQTPAGKKLSFEVVSVRAATPVGNGFLGAVGPQGNRFTMTGVTLKYLLLYAYRLPFGPAEPYNRIIGGPGWIDSDRFDIQAKAEDSITNLSADQARLMLQSLLEDRFQLKAHLESREVPGYNLVVAGGGLKMKLSEDQTDPAAAPPPTANTGLRGEPAAGRGLPVDTPRGMLRTAPNGSGRTLTGSAVRIPALLSFLQMEVGRPVIDKTEVNALFDFAIQLGPRGLASSASQAATVAAEPQITPAADPGASVFTAIQDLGLRLESARVLVEILVVESVQKPVQN